MTLIAALLACTVCGVTPQSPDRPQATGDATDQHATPRHLLQRGDPPDGPVLSTRPPRAVAAPVVPAR